MAWKPPPPSISILLASQGLALGWSMWKRQWISALVSGGALVATWGAWKEAEQAARLKQKAADKGITLDGYIAQLTEGG